jgi:hypothetical protein
VAQLQQRQQPQRQQGFFGSVLSWLQSSLRSSAADLHGAARNGELEEVLMLVRKGEDVNAFDWVSLSEGNEYEKRDNELTCDVHQHSLNFIPRFDFLAIFFFFFWRA